MVQSPPFPSLRARRVLTWSPTLRRRKKNNKKPTFLSLERHPSGGAGAPSPAARSRKRLFNSTPVWWLVHPSQRGMSPVRIVYCRKGWTFIPRFTSWCTLLAHLTPPVQRSPPIFKCS
ncbi:hypothetical protein NPIL_464661 [Nephila pilipes]|uniref:Uncharacterized protein n=1 Tax=Nephila pilipes TaxID=299642 RepID=A0A8X6PUL3_NEPPI|nr:hypothetical protein NPIL_464661 [Nephila pilipes]